MLTAPNKPGAMEAGGRRRSRDTRQAAIGASPRGVRQFDGEESSQLPIAAAAIRTKRESGRLPDRRGRNGLTLLETILAIAILGLSMAIIGELIRLGARHAERARDLTTAQILCESIVNEIAAGIKEPGAVDNEPCEYEPDWIYSVSSASVEQPGVLAVQVTVTRADDPSPRPVACTLIRWIPDPQTTADLSAAASSDSTSGASP